MDEGRPGVKWGTGRAHGRCLPVGARLVGEHIGSHG